MSNQRCRWGGRENGNEIICSQERGMPALTLSWLWYGILYPLPLVPRVFALRFAFALPQSACAF
jgi:hypothetical protein